MKVKVQNNILSDITVLTSHTHLCVKKCLSIKK